MTDLWKVARAIAKLSNEEIVFIGGVAAYLHAQRRPRAGLPLEMTHDVDAAISAVASGDLREREEVTENPRLHKWQIRVDDIEVDIYPDRVSHLRYSYVDLSPYAQKYRGFSIASIPHVLLLKVDALEDHGTSGKGAKDRRDTAKLLVLLHGSPQARKFLAALASPSDLFALRTVVRSTAFMEIARGNAKVASELRKKADQALTSVGEIS